jgi:hypothetical protein
MHVRLGPPKRALKALATIVAGAVFSQVAAVPMAPPAWAATDPLPRAYEVNRVVEVPDVVDAGWNLLALSADGGTAVHLVPHGDYFPLLVATTLSTGAQEVVGLGLDDEEVPRVVAAAVSADGRFVAFLAAGANAAELHLPDDADPYTRQAIFVRDRVTRSTTWVRTPDLGVAASLHSLDGIALSADGRRLASTISLPLPRYDGMSRPEGVLVATLPANEPPQTRVIGPEDLVAADEDPATAEPRVKGVALSGDGTVIAINATRNYDPVLLRFDAATGGRLPGDRALTSAQASVWRPNLDHEGRKTALGGAAGVVVADLGAGPAADVTLSALRTAPFVSGDLDMSFVEVATEAAISADGSTVEFVWAGALWTQPAQADRPAVLASPGLDGRIADPTGREVLIYPDAVVAPAMSADGTVLAFLSGSTAFVAPRTDEPPANETPPSYLYRSVPANLPGPTWPDGAALTTEAGTTTVAVSWPAASATTVSYDVTVNGEVAATVSAPATQVVLSELTPGSTVTVGVVARDAGGRASAALTATVTLLTDLPPGDAPLAVIAGPGARVHLQWDASTVAGLTGYRVLRNGTTLVDLAAEQTSYDDTAVAADTEYEYTVAALRGDEQLQLTRTVSVQTPKLVVTEAAAHLPPIGSTPYVAVGRDVTLAIIGSPGFMGTAELIVRTANEASTTVHVPLVEQPAGQYTGAWTIAEGTVEIVAGTLRLADGVGGGEEHPIAGLPARVGGLLRGHVDAPEGEADGVRVQLWSDTTKMGGLRQLTGDADIDIPVVPATDYLLTSVRSDGHPATEPRTLAIGQGEIVTVDLAPSLPASVTVTVVDASGRVVPDAPLTVTGAGTPRKVVTDRNGRALITGLDAGSTTTVTTDLSAGFLVSRGISSQPTTMVRLRPGDNPVELGAVALNKVRLSGVTRTEDGDPVRADIDVIQDLHGMSVHVRTRTAADGTWEAEVFAGLGTPTRIEARGIVGGYAETALTVGDAAPEAVRMDLPKVASRYSVTPTARVKMLDAELTEMPLDWRNAVHFDARLTWPGGEAAVDERVSVRAIEGTTLRLCVDGRESGLPAGCTEAVLGTDTEVPMAVTLVEQARFTAHVVDAAGAPVSGAMAIQVTDLNGAGSRRTTINGPDVSISVPGEGTYVLVISAGNRWIQRVVQATAGNITALGTLPLATSSIVDGSKTGITAVTPAVLPGGLVQVRADIQYRWPDAAGTARLTLPAGVTVPEDGVLLDGEVVPFTIEAGPANVLVVALPTAQARTLQVFARAPEKAGAQLPFTLNVTAGSASELVGTATVLCGYVSLTANKASNTGRVPLSGRAPAGATVVVRERGVEVARVPAGPGGLWQALVDLGTDGDDVRHHLLQAEAEVGGVLLQSTSVDVVVDPHAAVLLTVTMSQQGGRSVTFAATDGVARFPYTFVPNTPLVVTARFSGPVTDVRAQVADRIGTMQPVSGQPDTWQASLALGFGDLGDLSVTFTPVVERPILPVPPMPTESLVDPDEVTLEEPVVDGASVSQTFTAPVPALGPQARVTGRLVVTKLDDYQPSAADVARAKASGVYAYEVDLAMTPRDQIRRTGNLAMTASAVIDLATLHAGPETPLTQSLGALNFYTGPARAVFFWSYQVATNGDAFWSAGSEFFVDGKYAAVAKLQQMALACADSARSNYYHGRVELLLQKAASMDVFTASYTMAGLLLGPSSFGLATIAIWGIGWGMGKYMEYQFNSDVDGLTAEMMSDPECEYSEDAQNPENPENPESPDNPGLRRRDWQRRTAEPTWIHDPSGIVYEGTADRPVTGVTATLLTAPTAEGPWTVWGAEDFGQTNPLLTDEIGHYGWDVPEGWWKVVYAKDGYVTAESRVLRVLPPHTDVDVNLVRASLATVDQVEVDGDGLTITFDQPMRADQVLGGLLTVATSDGAPVAGQWAAVAPQPAPAGHPHAGEPLATSFRFTGERHRGEVVVTVDPSAQDHVGRAVLDGVQQTVAVDWTGPDSVAPQVSVTGVTPSAIYSLGAVPTAGCVTTDEGSGVATEAQVTITGGNAAGVGQFTATCAGAVDRAGNVAAPVSVTYTVGYVFTGFAPPVSNGGVLNQANAGQNIPIKWRLTTATGAPVTNLTTAEIMVALLDCASGRGVEEIEEYVASASGLQNKGDGNYQLNWKTPKTYAASCRTLSVNLGEGPAITHTASFQFK